MYVIYALIDPRDNTVRYVGMTNNVYNRFLEHITCSSSNFAKNAWIMELRAANKMVRMETLEEVEKRDEADARESYWIKHFEHMKEPIVNIMKTSALYKSQRAMADDIPLSVPHIKTRRPPEVKKDIVVTDAQTAAILSTYAVLAKSGEPVTRSRMMCWLHDNVSTSWNTSKNNYAVFKAICDEYGL